MISAAADQHVVRRYFFDKIPVRRVSLRHKRLIVLTSGKVAVSVVRGSVYVNVQQILVVVNNLILSFFFRIRRKDRGRSVVVKSVDQRLIVYSLDRKSVV